MSMHSSDAELLRAFVGALRASRPDLFDGSIAGPPVPATEVRLTPEIEAHLMEQLAPWYERLDQARARFEAGELSGAGKHVAALEEVEPTSRESRALQGLYVTLSAMIGRIAQKVCLREGRRLPLEEVLQHTYEAFLRSMASYDRGAGTRLSTWLTIDLPVHLHRVLPAADEATLYGDLRNDHGRPAPEDELAFLADPDPGPDAGPDTDEDALLDDLVRRVLGAAGRAGAPRDRLASLADVLLADDLEAVEHAQALADAEASHAHWLAGADAFDAALAALTEADRPDPQSRLAAASDAALALIGLVPDPVAAEAFREHEGLAVQTRTVFDARHHRGLPPFSAGSATAEEHLRIDGALARYRAAAAEAIGGAADEVGIQPRDDRPNRLAPPRAVHEQPAPSAREETARPAAAREAGADAFDAALAALTEADRPYPQSRLAAASDAALALIGLVPDSVVAEAIRETEGLAVSSKTVGRARHLRGLPPSSGTGAPSHEDRERIAGALARYREAANHGRTITPATPTPSTMSTNTNDFKVIPITVVENLQQLRGEALDKQQALQAKADEFRRLREALDRTVAGYNAYVEGVADTLGVGLDDYRLDLEAGRFVALTDEEKEAIAAQQAEAEEAAQEQEEPA